MGIQFHSHRLASTVLPSLARHGEAVTASLERLSTGLRINSIEDDAAGAGIAQTMHTRALTLGAAARSVDHGRRMAERAAALTDEVLDLLAGMKALATEALSTTTHEDALGALAQAFAASFAEIQRLAQEEFGGHTLGEGENYSVILGLDPFEQIGFDTADLKAPPISRLSIVKPDDPEILHRMVPAVQAAIDSLTPARASLAAALSRLDHTRRGLETEQQATLASESRIREADVALELASLTRARVLQAGAVALLAQTNVRPDTALDLLATMGLWGT